MAEEHARYLIALSDSLQAHAALATPKFRPSSLRTARPAPAAGPRASPGSESWTGLGTALLDDLLDDLPRDEHADGDLPSNAAHDQATDETQFNAAIASVLGHE